MITINAGQSTSFPRIADAIEAAKAYAPMPVTIHIAPGRYHEKLTVSQPHVTLMGDDASNTILTYDDYAREIMPDGIKRGTFRTDRKSTRLNSSHTTVSRMPSSA